MKILRILGVVLALAGLAGLIRGGFTYHSSERSVDVGSLRLAATRQHHVEIPPVLSGLVLAGGVGLFIISFKINK